MKQVTALGQTPPPTGSDASTPPPFWWQDAQDWKAGEQPAVPVRSRLHGLGRRVLWIALVCCGVALLFAPAPWRDPKGYAISLLYSFTYFLGLWLANDLVIDRLNLSVGWGERPLRRLVLTVLASTAASMLVIVAIPEIYAVLLWGRAPGYALRHGAITQGIFPLMTTVVISLFMHSRSFLLNWREATVRAERLEKESAVARLDSLRRQVDPHFLFNSLNALTSLVEDEPQRAVRFIRQLSSVYRYVLDSESQELVPLADELAFAEAYVYLQQTRLGDALRAELPTAATVPPGLYLPPLALQLLLENALKHNTAFQREPLRLRVSLDLPQRTLTVRNTLRPRPLSPAEVSGRGLANLRARYAFLTPRPLAAAPEGEEFVVTLPLLEL